MKDVAEFFSELFAADRWPARWFCGYWSPFHGWLSVVSDLMIWSAYFVIPFLILKYVFKKKDLVFYAGYFWFAAFILMCGLTHLLDAVIFWVPIYRVSVLTKFFTGIVSWLTVYYLIKLLPKAAALKTPDELQFEVNKTNALLAEMQKLNFELKKQKDFSEKILNATVEYIVVYDLNLTLIAVNRQTEILMKKNRSELIGKTFVSLFPESFGSGYHKNLLAASEGNSISKTITYSPAQRTYETNFVPLLENNRVYAVLVVAQDVTDQIQKEQELIDLNTELQGQNQKLTTANAELEQFANILSHDLQEPLRKIQIFSKMIAEDKDNPENELYLEKIDTSANRMKRLIDDVLEFAQLSAPNQSESKVDLSQVLEQIKNDLEFEIKEKEASIISDPLPIVQGVSHQFYQAFSNLITNALKYCSRTPVIKITCKEISYEGIQMSEITIKDNGIGFEEQYQDAIFTLFKRLHNKNEYEGTGIGLALVKKVIESHNGSISAQSILNEGSTFIIRLPLFSTI